MHYPENDRSGNKILLSGASGFLGSHLLQLLSSKGYTVRALYHRSAPSDVSSKLPGVEWMQCDLLDIFAIEEAMQGITQVYHCAAQVSFDSADKEAIIRNNQNSTANMVNAALEYGIKKMVFVSSIASLGRAESGELIAETTLWEESKSNTAYARSKFLAEMEVWRGVAEGLHVAIVNPGIILGAGDWNKGSAALIKIANKEFPFYTEGINAWVDVKDVAQAMVLIMESPVHSERFILSEGDHTYKEIFSLMAAALGKKAPHIAAPRWTSEILWRWYALRKVLTGKTSTISKETARTAQLQCHYDNSKFLRFFPEFLYTPLEQTITDMAKAYQNSKN